MKIKEVNKATEVEKEEQRYPWIGKGTFTGKVVLVINKNTFLVLAQEDSSEAVGKIGTCIGTSNFKPYSGTFEISN